MLCTFNKVGLWCCALKTTTTGFAHPPGLKKGHAGFLCCPLNNRVPSDENTLKIKMID